MLSLNSFRAAQFSKIPRGNLAIMWSSNKPRWGMAVQSPFNRELQGLLLLPAAGTQNTDRFAFVHIPETTGFMDSGLRPDVAIEAAMPGSTPWQAGIPDAPNVLVSRTGPQIFGTSHSSGRPQFLYWDIATGDVSKDEGTDGAAYFTAFRLGWRSARGDFHELASFIPPVTHV